MMEWENETTPETMAEEGPVMAEAEAEQAPSSLAAEERNQASTRAGASRSARTARDGDHPGAARAGGIRASPTRVKPDLFHPARPPRLQKRS